MVEADREALSSVGEGMAPDPGVVYDLLVIGGGPAAMTAAVYAARKMLKLAVVTDEFGGQVADTSEIENYIGFQMVTGQELTEKFVEHMKSFDVPCAQGEKVAKIAKMTTDQGELFAATREGRRSGSPEGSAGPDGRGGDVFKARTVVFAAGKRYRRLGVPGEEKFTGRGVSYCAICDAPFFRNKRVVVAGGGNSAFTAATDLLKLASEVTMVNVVPGWQADPIMFEPVSAHESVTLLDNHEITSIEGDRKVEKVQVRGLGSGAEKEIAADGVFVEIGGVPNSEPVRGLAALTGSDEVIVDCHCRTNVEGLFGAGDVTTVPYKQIVISAGEGAKAALSAYDYLTGRGAL